MSGRGRLRRVALIASILTSVVVGQAPADPAAVAEGFVRACEAKDATAAVLAAAAVAAGGDGCVGVVFRSETRLGADGLRLALRIAAEVAAPSAAEAARRLVKHDDAGVRADAVAATSAIAGATALPIFVAAASDADSAVRRRAFDALVLFGGADPSVLGPAAEGLTCEDTWIAAAAVQILDAQPPTVGRAQDPVVRTISRVATTLHPAIARPALDLVRKRGGPDAQTVILDAIDARASGTRCAALAVAADMRLEAAVPRAFKAARTDDRRVFAAAIALLADLHAPGTGEFLLDALADASETWRREAAAVGLRKLTGKTFGYSVEKWRSFLADHPEGRASREV